MEHGVVTKKSQEKSHKYNLFSSEDIIKCTKLKYVSVFPPNFSRIPNHVSLKIEFILNMELTKHRFGRNVSNEQVVVAAVLY